MNILQFQNIDYQDVVRIRDQTFAGMRLDQFIWQPCQQVESLQLFESASANPAMQRVNEKLGYKFNGLCEVRLVKPLE